MPSAPVKFGVGRSTTAGFLYVGQTVVDGGVHAVVVPVFPDGGVSPGGSAPPGPSGISNCTSSVGEPAGAVPGAVVFETNTALSAIVMSFSQLRGRVRRRVLGKLFARRRVVDEDRRRS